MSISHVYFMSKIFLAYVFHDGQNIVSAALWCPQKIRIFDTIHTVLVNDIIRLCHKTCQSEYQHKIPASSPGVGVRSPQQVDRKNEIEVKVYWTGPSKMETSASTVNHNHCTNHCLSVLSHESFAVTPAFLLDCKLLMFWFKACYK